MANEIFLTNNEKFHVFSKSPITPSMGLAQAVNKSGHTTTTADVWSQDIPWFFSADDKATALVTGKNAKLNDLVLIGSAVYKRNATEATEGAAFDTLWESLTLTNGTQLYNSDNKHVLTYHKGVPVDFLTTSNNAKQASNYAGRIFINGKVVEQFVASTDKITDGVPSTGYGVAVYKSGSPLSEGEAEANFIANSYAGIIQFNTKVGPSTAYTADVFEYVGDKLDTTLGDIDEKISKVVGEAFEGAVASVTADTNTKNLGLTVTEGANPVITVTPGSISDAKLVTGSTVKTYVDTTALAEGGAIKSAISGAISDATLTSADNAIESAEGDATSKLVTAAQVKEYVTENAQVTVTVGTTQKTSTGFEFAGSTGTDVAVAAAMDANGKVTYSATLSKATIDSTTGAITNGSGSLAVSASDAKTIVDTAIAALSATGGAIANLTTRVGEAESNAAASASAASASQTAAEEAESAAAAAHAAAQNAQLAADGAQSAANAAASKALASAQSAQVAEGAAQGSAQSASQSASAASASQTAAEAAQSAAESAAAEAKAAKDFVEALTIPEISTVNSGDQLDINDHVIEVKTSTFTAQTDTTSTSIGSMTANENGLATGATVVAVANDALRAAKAYSNSLHTTSVTYHVTDTLPTVPAGKEEEYKGRIYLVLTGVDGVKPADGDRIEYMYVQENGVWGWEQIGTTTADLAEYAKTADLNATNVGSGAVKVSQTNGVVSSVTVATEALVNNGAIKTSVTDANALVKAGDALAAIKLAKPDNYVASISGYTTLGSKVTTTQGAAITVLDDRRGSITTNDLWGTTATMDASSRVTIAHDWVTNPNASTMVAWNTSITKVENNKAYTGDTPYGSIQTERIKDGYHMFYKAELASFNGDLSSLTKGEKMFSECSSLRSFSSDLPSLTYGYEMFKFCYNLGSFSSNLSNLTNGAYMFSQCNNLRSFSSNLSNLTNGFGMFSSCTTLDSFSPNLSSLTNGSYMFSYCTDLNSFSSDLSNLTDGDSMFDNCRSLTSFSSDLPNLVEGDRMFYNTKLSSFNNDLSSLTSGRDMFSGCTNLESFTSDLSSLTKGEFMFNYCPKLTSFTSDLSSLTDGADMFNNCKLDTESVEIIADTINDVTGLNTGNGVTKAIDICIGNTAPNDVEDAAFKQMKVKGWKVYVNGSYTEYVPRTGETSLDETGETPVAPKPYWAKPIEVTEEEAEFVGEDGKFYKVVGGQFIYVDDPETYGMFVNREDAIANMRLTKYVKPVEEETEAQA